MTRRVAIVTGAANGIGRACAERLHREGLTVVVADREAGTAAEVADALAATDGTAVAIPVDIGSPGQCRDLVDEVVRRFGRVDILVNSAGSFIAEGRAGTEDDWDRILAVNVRGLALMVAAVAGPMGRQGGAIVNISSVSGYIAQPNRWTYNATKAAILTMTKCQALDLAPSGIRVNSVSPGWIWTREVAKAADGDRAKWEPLWSRYSILGRLGEPAEIAEAVEFLTSARASYITGTDLAVDGGYLALGPEGRGDDSRFAGAL